MDHEVFSMTGSVGQFTKVDDASWFTRFRTPRTPCPSMTRSGLR